MTQPTVGVTALPQSCDGRPVQRVILDNGSIRVALLTRGAILQDLRLAGVPHALTVGSPDASAYQDPLRYFGAIVGPVANRIAGGRARLDGIEHQFDRNEGGTTTLHGGADGTHARNWEIDVARADRATLTLALPDGTGGFPGNRTIAAQYALTGPDTLELTVMAATDAATWINFAPHGLWNLDGTPDLSGHTLRIASDYYLPVDETALVTGAVAKVAGSAFDFRDPRPIGPGTLPVLDHNFCLSRVRRAPVEVLTLTGAGGLALHVSTSEPGVQIYDAAGFDGGAARDHAGSPIGPGCGLAIEPQGWPDAPNRPGFPSVRVEGGTAVRQITRWRFSRPG
ncbi:galactose mutarotase [Meridianimarinicoccus roseus]|uniref:Galactose mutarotase n=1 Tax=Meridianimarinicoccus roseus TaxID=2072018 RepID=A0A2V2L664_9RHOB|nr:aldose epimerase family protein [Meridianimarinicoccus roseus]PWR00790.1 galactose mutarotase [Meridianimarinicoccus roseus]